MRARAQGGANTACLLLTGALVSGYAYVGATRSFFFSDEMESLYRLHEVGAARFLWVPLNVQLVPLHRLATWLLHSVFGVSFEAHVGAMWLLAMGYLWLLHRLVARIAGPGPLATLLVVFAGAYGIFGANMLWFSSCLHRLPYAIATLWAFDLWLRLRAAHPWRGAIAVTLLMLIAEGFYAKGVLLPFHVAAFELCLATRPDDDAGMAAAAVRRRWGALIAASGVAIAVALVAQRATGAELGTAGAPWFGVILAAAWRILSASLVGGVRPQDFAALPTSGAVVAGVLFVAGLLGASLWHRPRNALVWLVIVACALANGAVLALSDRGQVWGPLLAVSYRYYLDVTMVMLPMVATALSGALPPSPALNGRRGGVHIALPVVAALALVVAQVRSFDRLVAHDLHGHLKTRQVVDRLRAEVDRVRREVPPRHQTVQDEVLPRPLVLFPGFYSSVRHLFVVLEVPLPVNAVGSLMLEDDGSLVPRPANYRPDRRSATRRAPQNVLEREVRARWKELL